jgi:hypothetical protein
MHSNTDFRTRPSALPTCRYVSHEPRLFPTFVQGLLAPQDHEQAGQLSASARTRRNSVGDCEKLTVEWPVIAKGNLACLAREACSVHWGLSLAFLCRLALQSRCFALTKMEIASEQLQRRQWRASALEAPTK